MTHPAAHLAQLNIPAGTGTSALAELRNLAGCSRAGGHLRRHSITAHLAHAGAGLRDAGARHEEVVPAGTVTEAVKVWGGTVVESSVLPAVVLGREVITMTSFVGAPPLATLRPAVRGWTA